jgi:predicted transport protein
MEEGFDPESPQFDAFVRDYLTVKTRRIPNIYEIYPRFKAYVEQRRSAGASTEAIVADLHKYSAYYVRMARLREEDRQLRLAFADVNDFRVYVAYPFLLEVYDDYEQGKLTRDEFVQVMRLVESYAFRRVICGIPTNSLNKTFQNMGREIDKTRYIESVNLAFLLKGSYTRFPTDVEFKEQFVRRDVYNSPRVKYLLRKLENYRRKEPANVEEYTIEHIMPQNPNLSPEWQADLGPEWQSVQQTYLHTIGNLTLTGYNSSLSDRPFLEKRHMQGGFKDSPIRLNQLPGQLDHWNEATILERAHKLADLAVEIWPAPTVPTGVLEQHRTKKPYHVPPRLTIEEVVERSPEKHREVFWRLREGILSLDPSITERPHWEPEVYPYNHTSYRLKSTFADVVLQDRWVRVCLNIKKEALADPQGRARDVTGMGYWGSGDVLVTLTREDQVDYVLGLVRQAYNLQAHEGPGRQDFYVALGEGVHRTWEDCVRYGFISAGHGRWYSKPLEQLSPGSRVFVHVPGRGYTGVGIVKEGPVRVGDFKVELGGREVPILQAPIAAPEMGEDADDPELSEYVVRVDWERTVPLAEAVWEKGLFANQTIVCRLRDDHTLERLRERFDLPVGPPRQWDEASFMEELGANRGPEEVKVARSILDWARSRVTLIYWGQGSTVGSFVPILVHNGTKHQLFAVLSHGSFEVYFQWYQGKRPFAAENKRMELLSKLNSIEGVSIPGEAITRRPGIPLSLLRDESSLRTLFTTFDWFIEQVTAA